MREGYVSSLHRYQACACRLRIPPASGFFCLRRLPQNHFTLALLTFNVGVEAGQLIVVSAAYALYRVMTAVPRLAIARVTALYVIGSVAGYWSISRIITLLA